jgi:ABC-type transport system involved in cytochrome c biogenesis permease component
MTASRWLFLIILALLVVALIAFARGPDHQKGQDIGEQALTAAAEVRGG